MLRRVLLPTTIGVGFRIIGSKGAAVTRITRVSAGAASVRTC